MRNMKRILLLGQASHYWHEVIRGIYAYCRRHDGWEFHLEQEDNLEAMKRAKAGARSVIGKRMGSSSSFATLAKSSGWHETPACRWSTSADSENPPCRL